MLDAGLSCNLNVDYIFLTHGHSDHSANLFFHVMIPNKKIYVPREIERQVQAYLRAHFEISSISKEYDMVAAGYEIIGVHKGDQYEVINNGKKHRVTVYENDHSVPCVSFGFEEEVKGLKDEYRGLSGKELGLMRKEGIILENFSWVPRYVYIGDTSERVFELNEDIFKYPVIIVECTFLTDDDMEQATMTKHCHWRNLKPIIEGHPENMFILYHFSTRYKECDIIEHFRIHAAGLSNVHAWTHN